MGVMDNSGTRRFGELGCVNYRTVSLRPVSVLCPRSGERSEGLCVNKDNKYFVDCRRRDG